MDIIAEFKSKRDKFHHVQRIGLVFYHNDVFYVQDKVIREIDFDSHINLGFDKFEILTSFVNMADAIALSKNEDFKVFVDDAQYREIIAKMRKYKISLVIG
jgi:hypothetical protein